MLTFVFHFATISLNELGFHCMKTAEIVSDPIPHEQPKEVLLIQSESTYVAKHIAHWRLHFIC